ncbi:MAG TPA: hypothetical protein VGM92_04715 [Candidatus Kapabacteria bacterium]|jgi:hypothetical protein
MTEGLQMQSTTLDPSSAPMLKLARMVRLNFREIARRANVSPTTVEGVLKGRREQFASRDTEQRIYSVITKEAESLHDALNRLSGGATS